MLLILAGCSDASPSAEELSEQQRIITLDLDITTRAAAEADKSPDNFHLWIFNGETLLKYISDTDNLSHGMKSTTAASTLKRHCTTWWSTLRGSPPFSSTCC